LDYPVLQIKTILVSSHTAASKPVKQEVNGTVILPALVFPDSAYWCSADCRGASSYGPRLLGVMMLP
jgi:hypothetical protein